MTSGAIPPADVAIDSSVVRGLLQEQHPDLVHLALVDAGEGWDNRLFRLGDDLAIRLPRRTASAALIEHEQRWLPLLAPRLPLPIPVALRIGRPGCGFPWSWSVVPWFTGQSALLAPPEEPSATAVLLGRFLRALHQPAPGDAPHNPLRVRLRFVPRDYTQTSSRSTVSSIAAPCSICGSVWSRRRPGRDRHCGSTAIFIPAICWSTGAVSRP